MQKINWGIIGLGNIAQSFSNGFFNVDNSKLLAVASRDSNKLEHKIEILSAWFKY